MRETTFTCDGCGKTSSKSEDLSELRFSGIYDTRKDLGNNSFVGDYCSECKAKIVAFTKTLKGDK